MPVESAADRLSMLEDWDTGLYNASTTISGIFDNEYIGVPSGDIDVESASPAFTCQTSDVPSADHGDTLVVNSVTYTVRGVQPDGTGITVLLLESS